MKHVFWSLAVVVGCLLPRSPLCLQLTTGGIDPEALIERILAVDRAQKEEIRDVTFDAEYVEGERQGDKGFVEKTRFEKKVYIRHLPDTALYYEDYIAWYRDGRPQKQKDVEKEAARRKEDNRKRKIRDISYPVLGPFSPEHRDGYEIVYQGVAGEPIESQVCHHFTVVSKEEREDHINGEYYFEAASFHLVRVDFSPARLPGKMTFRLKEVNMSIVFGPTPEGFWLPKQFDVRGKGKKALIFGVRFAGTEYYRNPIINSDIGDDIFEVDDGE